MASTLCRSGKILKPRWPKWWPTCSRGRGRMGVADLLPGKWANGGGDTFPGSRRGPDPGASTQLPGASLGRRRAPIQLPESVEGYCPRMYFVRKKFWCAAHISPGKVNTTTAATGKRPMSSPHEKAKRTKTRGAGLLPGKGADGGGLIQMSQNKGKGRHLASAFSATALKDTSRCYPLTYPAPMSNILPPFEKVAGLESFSSKRVFFEIPTARHSVR